MNLTQWEAEDPEPRATPRRHLDAVERQLRQCRELRDRLARVLDALEGDGAEANVELLLEVIEKMTMFEQYLTPDQRTWFTQRRERIGEDAWQAALDQWPQLIAQVRAEMDAGTDPGDLKVRQLVERWDELGELFIGDQPEIRTAAGQAWQSMWAGHAEQLRKSPRVAPPEMWDYIQRARRAR